MVAQIDEMQKAGRLSFRGEGGSTWSYWHRTVVWRGSIWPSLSDYPTADIEVTACRKVTRFVVYQ